MNSLAKPPKDPLSPAERQAWTLAQQGMSTRAIATHLNRSRSTIRSQLENSRRKLAHHTHGRPTA